MILKCKMCGGDIELAEDKTLATCECCGNTMTLPKINNDQRASLFNRGNHFRRNGEFDKALGVYENILREDDSDAEAHWCCALCRFGIEYVEDPSTYEWIPTCHRASFDSILEDVDYLAALEYSDGVTKKQYQKEAIRIADVQKSILATSQNEEPFDVFICYKESDENGDRTVDSTLAQDIYYQLTDAGFRVFFSRITLEDKVGSEYEPYIFAALNSAKVMIVVGTKPEYYNAVWVKNEWGRYLAMMRKDRTKLLLPCYRDMDPYEMPEALSILQSYDMSKIGFIQDLIRGVRKVVQTETEADKVTATQRSEAEYTVINHAVAKIKRGNMALEDREWEKAAQFFEEALNEDPEAAEAYLGEFLVEEKCSTVEELVKRYIQKNEIVDIETLELIPQYENYEEHIQKQVQEKSIEGYLSEKMIRDMYPASLEDENEKVPFNTDVRIRGNNLNDVMEHLNNNRLLSRARQYATGELSDKIEQMIMQIHDVDQDRYVKSQQAYEEMKNHVNEQFVEKVQEIDADVEKKHNDTMNQLETEYQELVKRLDRATTVEQCESIIKRLRPLATGKYKDSLQLMSDSNRKMVELKLQEKEEKYQECLKKMQEATTRAQYEELVFDWKELRDYKDAEDQVDRCREEINKITLRITRDTRKVQFGVIVATILLVVCCVVIGKRSHDAKVAQQELKDVQQTGEGGFVTINGEDWLVLEKKEKEALLLHRNKIDLDSNEVDEKHTKWSENPIRIYLNGTFLKEMFNSYERKRIISKKNNNAYCKEGEDGSNKYVKDKDTTDKIFLLSEDEVKELTKNGWIAYRMPYNIVTRTSTEKGMIDSTTGEVEMSVARGRIYPAMWVKID